MTWPHTKKNIPLGKPISRLKYAVLLQQWLSQSSSTLALCGQGCDIDWVIDWYFTQDQVLRFHDVSAGRFPSGLDMLSIVHADSIRSTAQVLRCIAMI